MKKLVFLTLLLSVALLFVSCQVVSDTRTEKTTDDDKTVAETLNTDENTETADVIESTITTEADTESSEVTQKPEYTTSGPEPEPSPYIVLDSFDEIIKFVCVCNGSEAEFNRYMEINYHEEWFEYAHAVEMYENILSSSIIIPKDGVACDDYGIAYYPNNDELIESFLIDGIRYQFVYWYSSKEINNTDIFEGEPAFKDVPFGDSTIDLYLDYGAYRSYTTINGLTFRVSFTANTEFSFDNFDFTFDIAKSIEEYKKEDVSFEIVVKEENTDNSNRKSYYFNSYEGFADVLNNIENSSLKDGIEKCGKYYPKVLEAFENKTVSPLIPYFEDSRIPLLSKNDSIIFMTSEDYSAPWIWYHCLLGDEYLRVEICYFDILDMPRTNTEQTFLEVRKAMYSALPTPESYTYMENHECKNVYEKEINVCGITVTALINEKNNGYSEIGFRMDGMLVMICGTTDMLTEEFLGAFNLRVS